MEIIIIIEDDDSNKNEQVSRLLQMPAGVSEHCSVVSQMIIFMMVVLLVNIHSDNDGLECWWCTC